MKISYCLSLSLLALLFSGAAGCGMGPNGGNPNPTTSAPEKSMKQNTEDCRREGHDPSLCGQPGAPK